MEGRRRRFAGQWRNRRGWASLEAAAILLGVLVLPGPVGAFSGGVTGKAESGCGPCHGLAPSFSTTVRLEPIPAGSGFDLGVEVADPSVPPSQDPNGALGGFDLRARFGSLSAKDSAVKVLGSEATHAGTTGNRQRRWVVRWEPSPPSVCAPLFSVAANAVNGDGQASGDDHWNLASASVTLTEPQNSPGPTDLGFVRPRSGTLTVNSISLALPSGLTIVTGNAVVLEASVRDETGISKVEFFDQGPLGEPASLGGEVVSADESGIRARAPWNALATVPGPHVLRVEATDCGGHTVKAEIEVLVL